MNVFLSRYLKADNSGWVFYLSNNFSFIIIVAGLTMETAVNYYSSRKEIDDNQLTWFSIVWSLIVTLIVFTTLWTYFKVFKAGENAPSNYFFYAICYVCGIQLTNFFTVLFYSNKNFFLPNFLMVVINLIFIIIIAEHAYNAATSSIIGLYFLFFMITGLTLAVAFIVKKQSWKDFSLPGYGNCSLLFRYAIMALAANAIFFLVYRIDYWFVEKYATAKELGNYIQVSKLGQMLLVVPTIISSVVFPFTAGRSAEDREIKDNIMRIGRIATMLFSLLFILIILTGKLIFPFVFGPTFYLMYVPFLILLPGIWALSNLNILSAYFGGSNRIKVNVQGAALALIVILIGDISLIPHYGIIAAALVSTIGYGVNFLYSFYVLQKEHSVSFSSYLSINKEDIQWLKSIISK